MIGAGNRHLPLPPRKLLSNVARTNQGLLIGRSPAPVFGGDCSIRIGLPYTVMVRVSPGKRYINVADEA
ncbi:hypothetical protein LK533_16410 [Sphingomonas sp. PL-96]|uniref:hypothetical protein n=1 Tax=Sphingomonas sp. PL-96 TaxID=2887201 RepID=UPI001E5277F8|nr:hypothetical protein [Sphingomonas sp. PL-96]MCC2978239.1 hypothetical protein [Sphingomonas sp. PL-96]